MALPWASVIVTMVLLNEALTCATPDVMFFLSRRLTRATSLAMLCPYAFFLPAMGRAGPLRVRALVWVRCPRTGRRRRCRRPR